MFVVVVRVCRGRGVVVLGLQFGLLLLCYVPLRSVYAGVRVCEGGETVVSRGSGVGACGVLS